MNKNTKILARHLRLARKAQQSQVVRMVPVYNYHSAPNNSLMRPQTIPVHFMDSNGVISKSPARNMQERVYRNFGQGANASRTFHEPIERAKPTTTRGHGYMEYRQFPA